MFTNRITDLMEDLGAARRSFCNFVFYQDDCGRIVGRIVLDERINLVTDPIFSVFEATGLISFLCLEDRISPDEAEYLADQVNHSDLPVMCYETATN